MKKDIVLKAYGFDFLTAFIFLMATVISYGITVNLFQDGSTIDDRPKLLMGAFVFIIPLFIESVQLLSSIADENREKNIIDVAVAILGIILFFVISIVAFFGVKSSVPVIKKCLLLYPGKYFSNALCTAVTMIKERSNKK